MRILKNMTLGVCGIAFVLVLIAFLKFGINYSKDSSKYQGGNALKHEIVMAVDEIVRSIELEEVDIDNSRYMVGTFINTTGCNLPMLKIHYEILNSSGTIIKENAIEYKNVVKGAKEDIKIPVDSMFNYTLNLTSNTNLGL